MAKSAKQIATEYFGAVGARDVDAMMTFWKPGGYAYIHGVADLRAPDGYHEWFGGLFRAFPDFKFEIVEIVAYGDKATVRWRARGTFSGEGKFEGLVPNGATVDMEGLDLLTIKDGKIEEIRAYMNQMEMARQLGVMPPSGSVPEKAMFGALNAKTAAVAAIRKRRSG
jgi:predicted ester cyclase